MVIPFNLMDERIKRKPEDKSKRLPLVSCLTLTKNRLLLVKQAIECFCLQSYQNKELVIISAGTKRYQTALKNHIDTLERVDINLVLLPKEHIPIGTMRNISLDQAKGKYICIWDDDDLYHKDRINIQYSTTVNHQVDACYLTDHLHWFDKDRSLYWVNWKRFSTQQSMDCMVPGTLFMKRPLKIRYPEYDHAGEDNIFRSLVFKNYTVYGLSDYGYLYIYRVHGANQCPNNHHKLIVKKGCVELSFIENKWEQLKEVLTYLKLPMPLLMKGPNEITVYTFN
ncbi:hypothetical protein AEQU3_03219 [Aequorivita antarctica]|nr:hypothetical protein AEQU3_03219 [Aequorivita antarctica]